MIYVGFVSEKGCLMVGLGHLAVFLIVFSGIMDCVWGVEGGVFFEGGVFWGF